MEVRLAVLVLVWVELGDGVAVLDGEDVPLPLWVPVDDPAMKHDRFIT